MLVLSVHSTCGHLSSQGHQWKNIAVWAHLTAGAGLAVVGSDTAHSSLQLSEVMGSARGGAGPHTAFRGPAPVWRRCLAQCVVSNVTLGEGRDRVAWGFSLIGLEGVCIALTWPLTVGRNLGCVPFLLTEIEKLNSTGNKSTWSQEVELPS